MYLAFIQCAITLNGRVILSGMKNKCNICSGGRLVLFCSLNMKFKLLESHNRNSFNSTWDKESMSLTSPIVIDHKARIRQMYFHTEIKKNQNARVLTEIIVCV